MSIWDEIEGILAENEGESTYPTPLWIDLTPDGKTFFIVYPGEHQEEIAEAIINTLGEPEVCGYSEENPENLWLLFAHQNLPEEIKDIAEQMTTATLLQYLHIRQEGGIVI